MSDFFSKDLDQFNSELVEQLYDRLNEVRRCLGVRVERFDEFEQGINCRAVNEEAWLEALIDKIEKSR